MLNGIIYAKVNFYLFVWSIGQFVFKICFLGRFYCKIITQMALLVFYFAIMLILMRFQPI